MRDKCRSGPRRTARVLMNPGTTLGNCPSGELGSREGQDRLSVTQQAGARTLDPDRIPGQWVKMM